MTFAETCAAVGGASAYLSIGCVFVAVVSGPRGLINNDGTERARWGWPAWLLILLFWPIPLVWWGLNTWRSDR